MSALRRGWRATEFVLRHGRCTVRVHRWGDRWMWLLLEDAASPSMLLLVEQGEADSLSAAQAAAEAAIEQRLARLTREEILLEAARVDCREVRS